jgi:hypothetical protein
MSTLQKQDDQRGMDKLANMILFTHCNYHAETLLHTKAWQVIPQLETWNIETSLFRFEVEIHLLIVRTLITNNNSPLRFQIHQCRPTDEDGNREIYWDDEGVQDEFDPLVRRLQDDRHHDTSQGLRTWAVHDMNVFSSILSVECRSMRCRDGVVEFLNSEKGIDVLLWR